MARKVIFTLHTIVTPVTGAISARAQAVLQKFTRLNRRHRVLAELLRSRMGLSTSFTTRMGKSAYAIATGMIRVNGGVSHERTL